MKLKTCSCGNVVTTKNVVKVMRHYDSGRDTLWFSCRECGSTLILKAKPKPSQDGLSKALESLALSLK